MTLFEQMLKQYPVTTNRDYIQATHEVMQQIALAGLYRGGFFEHAAFYGGTCLRIFHETDRFSEDMDFSLLKPNDHFTLEPYFPFIIREFTAAGRDVVLTRKQNTRKTTIESAFLKDESPTWSLSFQSDRKVKIKIELDTIPPGGFSTTQHLLLTPFSFFVRCYSLEDLFAGKMHALLFRSWKTRVKGRDWYDFEWYVRKGVVMNFNHFLARSIQSGHLREHISQEYFLKMLREKIRSTAISQVLADVKPFLRQTDPLGIWSDHYFLALTEKMKLSHYPNM
jgi:predicted nucleotidyltransferase component of viral defense system